LKELYIEEATEVPLCVDGAPWIRIQGIHVVVAGLEVRFAG